jgi:predicted Zn-dependent protease
MLRLISLLTLLAAVAGGCAHSPDWDKKVGEQASKELVANVGLYDDDPNLTAYVNAVGQRIVAQVDNRPYDFDFHILDQPIPNALSLPGGHVYVTRGLLVLTNSPDELACVLGHETTHVIKRHAAQRSEAATVPGILSLPGAVVGTVVPIAGDLLAAPARVGGAVALAGYSRDQEREADHVGQELAAKAGYDPHALASALDRLGQFEALKTNPHDQRIPDFLQTHPQTPERVSTALKRADQLAATTKPSQPPGDRDAFLSLLDGLVLHDNPAAGVFVNSAFLHPTFGFAFAVPAGWLTENSPSAVAIVSPKQDAAVMLDRPAGLTSPDQAADQFTAELKRQGIAAPAAESLTIDNYLPARRIALLARQDDGTDAHIDVTWLQHRGVTYRFLAIATSSGNLTAVRSTVDSFHDLTSTERASIKVTRLRVIPAREGETLADVSRRTDNQWDTKTTAVVNGIDAATPLHAGQLVKVAQTEVYAAPSTPSDQSAPSAS